MATKSVTLKDSNGDTLYPVTDSNVVNINQQKTLAQALDGVVYAEDPTAAATASPWVTGNDIDWSTIVTVLYDGGTTGTTGSVTLSESVVNFSRIKIFYKNNDSYYSSVEVWQPQGKTVTLICDSAPTGNAWYGKVGTYSISGTTLTKTRSLQLSAGSSSGIVDNVYIVVTRVEGWKI